MMPAHNFPFPLDLIEQILTSHFTEPLLYESPADADYRHRVEGQTLRGRFALVCKNADLLAWRTAEEVIFTPPNIEPLQRLYNRIKAPRLRRVTLDGCMFLAHLGVPEFMSKLTHFTWISAKVLVSATQVSKPRRIGITFGAAVRHVNWVLSPSHASECLRALDVSKLVALVLDNSRGLSRDMAEVCVEFLHRCCEVSMERLRTFALHGILSRDGLGHQFDISDLLHMMASHLCMPQLETFEADCDFPRQTVATLLAEAAQTPYDDLIKFEQFDSRTASTWFAQWGPVLRRCTRGTLRRICFWRNDMEMPRFHGDMRKWNPLCSQAAIEEVEEWIGHSYGILCFNDAECACSVTAVSARRAPHVLESDTHRIGQCKYLSSMEMRQVVEERLRLERLTLANRAIYAQSPDGVSTVQDMEGAQRTKPWSPRSEMEEVD